jgi:hypothetical protein
MAVIAYGGRRHWEGKIETQVEDVLNQIDRQYESTKQLCLKHQEHIEHLDIKEAILETKVANHEQRIFSLEAKDK